MARSPDGKLISLAEAKARLLECGRREPAAAEFARNPVVWTGAALAAGVLSGVVLRRYNKNTTVSSSLRSATLRSILAVAPLLIEQWAKNAADRAGSPSRKDS